MIKDALFEISIQYKGIPEEAIKPPWDGVFVWDEDKNEIFIEVKSSRQPSGIFYLTRNEWNFSLSVKDSFLIHLWIQDQEKPRIISFTQLHSKNYTIEDASNAEWSDIKITPIKENITPNI